jgi:fructokinase
MNANSRLYGCIEAGGTKFVVAIARNPNDIVETARFDTVSPDITIGAVIGWMQSAISRHGPLTGIGIASFGPLELDRGATGWGFITRTTKPGWSDCDFGGRIVRKFGVPVGFDTDVNGAALAESRWGAAAGHNVSVYITVGTGVGGGAIVGGKPLLGLSHPEMGHFRPVRHERDQEFAGVCPFHGDCIEGLASGPAISARWGATLSQLGADHPAHAIIAYYLAQMAVTLQSFMEPGCIIFGGGVMATPGMLERVRSEATRLGGGYFRGKADTIICAPGLGDNAGLLGGLALAMDAASGAASAAPGN